MLGIGSVECDSICRLLRIPSMAHILLTEEWLRRAKKLRGERLHFVGSFWTTFSSLGKCSSLEPEHTGELFMLTARQSARQAEQHSREQNILKSEMAYGR